MAVSYGSKRREVSVKAREGNRRKKWRKVEKELSHPRLKQFGRQRMAISDKSHYVIIIPSSSQKMKQIAEKMPKSTNRWRWLVADGLLA
jgi:hypothetical protein